VITRSLEHKKQVPHFLTNPISDALAVIVSSGTLVRVICKAVRMHSSQYEWPCLFSRNSETCFNFICRNCLGIVSCGTTIQLRSVELNPATPRRYCTFFPSVFMDSRISARLR
jgi:hypothetical protein